MAQSIQIAPKYSFPYVETVINDYTVVNNTNVADVSTDTAVRYIFPFVSSKGIDNRFIRKRTRSSIVSAYGETNWKKYGQPLMQALHVAEAPNAEVWCMRVMPDDATYAHNIISAYYKADTAADVATASDRKFRIKYVQKTASANIVNTKDLVTEAAKLDGAAVNGVYTDGDGYIQIPGMVTLYALGRGQYGNNYRVRIAQDVYYEKEYGIKYYDFEVISTETGLTKEATYIGSHITSVKYDKTTFITDVLNDTNEGDIPLFINIDEAGVEDLYNAYVEWVTDLVADLETELASATDDTVKTKINTLITEAQNIPAVDEFDVFFGRKVASMSKNPFIEFPAAQTDDVVHWDDITGVKLFAGDDGAFANSDDATALQDVIDSCYINALSGVYDKRILSTKRIKANALWDANYSMKVKNTLADLAMLRNDAVCYLDCGIMESFADTVLSHMINDYAVFDDYKISKNVHHYIIKESTTKKRVPVTITYFLSRQYADHLMNYGSHIPFVKSYAQLSGHVKDTLAPSVEDFETELKEILTENRFNFFETVDDNVYQRATQSTAQMTTSDLLEENNVTTMYEMKRIIEADITDALYDFSNTETRNNFRDYERAKFADWVGREVENFDITFRMNNWEAERSILHAYLEITFRGLQKRAILEIDINKRVSADETADN